MNLVFSPLSRCVVKVNCRRCTILGRLTTAIPLTESLLVHHYHNSVAGDVILSSRGQQFKTKNKRIPNTENSEQTESETNLPERKGYLTNEQKKLNLEEIYNRVHSRVRRDKNFKFNKEDTEAKEDKENRLSRHFFKRLYPWKSKEELAGYLCQHIIYEADGIIAVNKPFGVGVRNVVDKRETELEKLRRSGKEIPDLQTEFDHLHHTRGTGSCDYTLEDVLPILSSRLQQPQLNLVRSTDKFTSGVAIFSTDSVVTKKIQESVNRNKQNGIKSFSYYVISTNVSRTYLPHGIFTDRVAITFAENESTKISHPIITRDFSKRAVKSGDVKSVDVELTLLDQNLSLNVCCSQIETTTTRHNFLRIYYASIVSPILGDHLYSSRVASICGVMALVPPAFVRIGRGEQVLSSQLISTLRLRKPDESILVPLHAHLQSFTLGNFNGKGKHVKLIAPPLPVFEWTCRQLSLKLPKCN